MSERKVFYDPPEEGLLPGWIDLSWVRDRILEYAKDHPEKHTLTRIRVSVQAELNVLVQRFGKAHVYGSLPDESLTVTITTKDKEGEFLYKLWVKLPRIRGSDA